MLAALLWPLGLLGRRFSRHRLAFAAAAEGGVLADVEAFRRRPDGHRGIGVGVGMHRPWSVFAHRPEPLT